MYIFCRNEKFLAGFRVNETGIAKIEHRQFLAFPCNKKPGLKLDDS